MDRSFYKKSRQISVGKVKVGGGAAISIQSMTNTKTIDHESTLSQIYRLADLGCDIIRCTLPDYPSVPSFKKIVEQSPIPVIADIHFDHKLAIMAFDSGAECVRINPGNIGSEKRLIEVIAAAKANDKSIRVGVNSGSIKKEFLDKYGVCAKSMVESALESIAIFEKENFFNIKISLKASNVPLTISSYREFAKVSDYPLHLGVTESGIPRVGIIKSAIGIGALLADGIGDTIRVSLTSDPAEEILAGIEILKSLGLKKGVEIISCPTCGRTEIDLIPLAESVNNILSKINKQISVAVMGCIVNGPGEARECDYGIAGGKGKDGLVQGILFRKGEIVKKVSNDRLLDELMIMIKSDGVL